MGAGPAGCAAALNLRKLNINTLIIERKKIPREKTCGGLLTKAGLDFIEDYLELNLDSEVFETPKKVGLYYSPPAGFSNGGKVKNYLIYNINRTKFDYWLTKKTLEYGANLFTDTKVNKIYKIKDEIILETLEGKKIRTKYLIGADGVKSYVRKEILDKNKIPPLYIKKLIK